MAIIKTKYQPRINLETEIGLAVSQILPNFDEVCTNKQAHTPHLCFIFLCYFFFFCYFFFLFFFCYTSINNTLMIICVVMKIFYCWCVANLANFSKDVVRKKV